MGRRHLFLPAIASQDDPRMDVVEFSNNPSLGQGANPRRTYVAGVPLWLMLGVASAVLEHDQRAPENTAATPTEAHGAASEDVSPRWILNSTSFTEYYGEGLWMCWAPATCLGYIIYVTIFLLDSRSGSGDSIQRIAAIFLWLALEQGAIIQYYVLLCSYVTTRWRRMHAAALHIIMCCCAAVAPFCSVISVVTSPTASVSAINLLRPHLPSPQHSGYS
ncbi:hypothetical protein GGS23DRAFT_445367 [Durotheca rogersii]|uniref:uncharacterized protein n=1 Tax=Durotheca rogersii TaxID=419775 RepID=UPI00221EBE15|nr:uncharacterized protein GGS23DRAFT_445367 [Durotheca rogersii]KAI5855130.1 hypothetical protein GGS23DRAFT_445367 [Durotheca rogersii]